MFDLLMCDFFCYLFYFVTFVQIRTSMCTNCTSSENLHLMCTSFHHQEETLTNNR